VAAALLKGETLSDDAIEVAAGGVAKPVDNTGVELARQELLSPVSVR
jgi:hypothetical protein